MAMTLFPGDVPDPLQGGGPEGNGSRRTADGAPHAPAQSRPLTAEELHHQAAQAYRTARALARGRLDAGAAFDEAYRLAREAAAAFDRQPAKPRGADAR